MASLLNNNLNISLDSVWGGADAHGIIRYRYMQYIIYISNI